VTTAQFSPHATHFPAATQNRRRLARRLSSRPPRAPDFLAAARHKIFDNQFSLKYIQALGLRKISHLQSRHAWALALPIRKAGKAAGFYHGAWSVFFINPTLNLEL